MEIVKNNIKKVTIGAINDSTIDVMVLNALINQKPLMWCNKILFSVEMYMPTDWVMKAAAQGEIYLLTLTKASMPKYSEKLTHQDSKSEIPVANMTNHKFWQEVLDNV